MATINTVDLHLRNIIISIHMIVCVFVLYASLCATLLTNMISFHRRHNPQGRDYPLFSCGN